MLRKEKPQVNIKKGFSPNYLGERVPGVKDPSVCFPET
jgi:hypothetical protein